MAKYPFLLAALLLSSLAQATPIFTEHTTDEDATEIFLNLETEGAPLRFALDTGADYTGFGHNPQTAKFFTIGKGKTMGAGGKAVTCDIIAPPALTLDGQKLDIPIAVRSKYLTGNNLGLDVLDGKIFKLDFDAMEFNLMTEAPSGLEPLVKLESFHVALPVLAGGLKVSALFDTGLGMTLVSAGYVKAHPEQFSPGFKSGVMTDINGTKIKIKGYKLKTIQVGGMVFNDVLVAAYDSKVLNDMTGENISIVLGNNLITKANWILDLKNYRWAIQKRAE